MFAVLMHFYPGLTPLIIKDLTWREFYLYLKEIGPLLKLFMGMSTTSGETIANLAREKGISPPKYY